MESNWSFTANKSKESKKGPEVFQLKKRFKSLTTLNKDNTIYQHLQ